MSSEYLNRREFNKRVILGGAAALVGAIDMSNTDAELDQLNKEAKKELIERGITPPAQDDKALQSKEEKAQQVVFDKEVKERFDEKPNVTYYKVRGSVDTVVFAGGLVAVLTSILRKRPSYGPFKEG
jgi:hypothetical protein